MRGFFMAVVIAAPRTVLLELADRRTNTTTAAGAGWPAPRHQIKFTDRRSGRPLAGRAADGFLVMPFTAMPYPDWPFTAIPEKPGRQPEAGMVWSPVRKFKINNLRANQKNRHGSEARGGQVSSEWP